MAFPSGKGECVPEIWFTRNGVREGGWSLDEEVDSERGCHPREGMEGTVDIYAAIGVWGPEVVVEVSRVESS
jgi:hypothetical protein